MPSLTTAAVKYNDSTYASHDPEPPTITPPNAAVDLRGLDGLTLYEKKCVLINREIDAQGMGRYQWYIWGLCGFGYLLDLLWAQAFGLVLSPLQQELGFGDNESGNISTSFNAGMTAGAFFWGFLADIVGERHFSPPFNNLMLMMTICLRTSLGIQLDLLDLVGVRVGVRRRE